MKDALLLILGGLISAWTGLATAKIFLFRQLKSRVAETFVEATRSEAIDRFARNVLYLHEAFLPVQVALRSAGHYRAAKDVEKIINDISGELIAVLAQVKPGEGQHGLELQFRLKAWVMLNERRDLTQRLEEIRPDRGVLIEPFW